MATLAEMMGAKSKRPPVAGKLLQPRKLLLKPSKALSASQETLPSLRPTKLVIFVTQTSLPEELLSSLPRVDADMAKREADRAIECQRLELPAGVATGLRFIDDQHKVVSIKKLIYAFDQMGHVLAGAFVSVSNGKESLCFTWEDATSKEVTPSEAVQAKGAAIRRFLEKTQAYYVLGYINPSCDGLDEGFAAHHTVHLVGYASGKASHLLFEGGKYFIDKV